MDTSAPGRPKEGDVPFGATARSAKGAPICRTVSRREFLQATGALVIGLSFAGDADAQRVPALEAAIGKTLELNDVDGLLAVGDRRFGLKVDPKAPLGAGEAAATPVPAALANAVFDAAGIRLRTVPFTRQRVLAALA